MAKGSRKLPPDVRALTLICQAWNMVQETRYVTGKKRLDLWRNIWAVVNAADRACTMAIRMCEEEERKDDA